MKTSNRCRVPDLTRPVWTPDPTLSGKTVSIRAVVRKDDVLLDSGEQDLRSKVASKTPHGHKWG